MLLPVPQGLACGDGLHVSRCLPTFLLYRLAGPRFAVWPCLHCVYLCKIGYSFECGDSASFGGLDGWSLAPRFLKSALRGRLSFVWSLCSLRLVTRRCLFLFPWLGIDVWSLPARFLLHYAGFADLCVEPEVFPEVSGPPVRWEVYHDEEHEGKEFPWS